ncbi:hypothetical protein [Rothia mucilaginosa]|uniref:hypothetical protein n=1 Tax=Rothia mucilaginosa TaxID=43675 RepID=UPI000AFDFFC9|nr:hypothetical protein [Rothia mucilaginosa]
MSQTPMSASSPAPIPAPSTNSPIPQEQMHQRQDLLEHLRQVKQLVDRAAPWADSMKSAQKAYVAAVPEPPRIKLKRLFVACFKLIPWTYLASSIIMLIAYLRYLYANPQIHSSDIPWHTIHVPAIVSAIVIAALWWSLMYFVAYPLAAAKVERENNKRRAHNDSVWSDYEEPAIAELSKVHNEYMERFSHWFPEDYLYPNAADTLYKYVRQGRTYTLQEALNLYEQERHQLWVRLSMEEQARETRIHNAIVEDMMDKQLYEQRRANVLLSGILVATTATAVAASAPRYHYHYHY